VVILTRDVAIPVLSSIVAAPITTTSRGIDSEVALGSEEGLQRECVVSCDSVVTVPRTDLDSDPVGALGLPKLVLLDRALRYALQIRF
jgi:mRNA interferase MazF